jgi:NAD(P)-dependent dehydrogenase (short-subunit alcohol dehydrogenase family)
MEIQDRVAVITGAASGIGEATAGELARRGVRAVVLVDQNDHVLEIAEEMNRGAGRRLATARIGSVTDEKFRMQVFDEAEKKFGLVTICVPAAGITRDALAVRVDSQTQRAELYPLETFRLVTEVNMIAPIYWAMEMIARIAQDRARKGLGRWAPEEPIQGSVVLIGSVSSQGNKGQISYAVSKAGLQGAAATLSKEAIFYGVRCALIHPGFTDTPMVRALGAEYIDNKILPFTQLRRLIRTDEIADAICFLFSNSAVSGELWADAGWHPPA